ncbi:MULTISPECIES: ABC transporter ATP-binding protein [Clostridium]|uniref:ABC transporter ATP-binding protein n=3 Tax=Clostridium TaxID=1485 RepID=D8GI90_CLOLD|nr:MULTISPECIES: ABC transporter ATP-binding protein [Clostridium]ADK14952.1 predicted ABC-type transporter, transmembrane component [Clostridium ljungdahlii DSM 13528]OAA87946.1 putative ABC transporter ATP-binding protein [Clostridium ljungdahlii DSM 13528]OAA94031.1 putative ABC transporter ATP-binding protein [Clostridium coskatii]OBR96593.1 putative ABC transporter ATP-binding protein [Clostridium coskatii]RMD03279.1 ABC transporter ATP-binding protein [Clostridium autoethanogenum]
MIKLIKHLKPFVGLIIAAVMLLFVQAMCDLALPDYTSNIVNKGIQQGGIVSSVPQAIRESQMKKIKIFMNKSDLEEVSKSYVPVDKSNADYTRYLKKYPNLKNEPIFVLKDVDKNEMNKLSSIMGRSIIDASGVEQIKSSAKNGIISFNGMKIPASADLFDMISKMPDKQRLRIIEDINKKASSLDDNMVIQLTASKIKAEYKALGMNTDKIQSKYIINVGVTMLFISLLGGVCTVAVGFLAARTAAGLARNLRKNVFEKVENFSNAEFDKFSTASLITRSTNDITQIQMLMVIMIRMVFYAPIMGIGGVIRAMGKSKSMSWIIALAVIVLLGLILVVFAVAFPKFKIIQKLIDKLNLVTRENLSGMMVIRAFNTQKFEEERFDKANKDVTKTNLFVNRVMVSMMPVMMFVMNGITLLIIWVGSHEVANSNMQVGDMMAFMQYAMQIIMAFLMLAMMFILIPRASVSAGRIEEVLETDISIVDPEDRAHFQDNIQGLVEFNNVSFRYPGAGEDALKNVSFKALPGKTTAFIGSTGSGKTTLVNLIMRFYDATSGEVLVDGVNVKKITQHELRDKIGYVPQKGYLFSGTIESNLKYGDKKVGYDGINHAIEVSQSEGFINEKTKGIKSEISEGGSNVSGGQKQRLSIARALVKKPEIYVFDDSFSALDFKTDAALRKALRKETTSSTFLIVAQRISTIMDADQIIVLDDGNVVGIGTHEELMKNCETYREIALSQLSKEELA